MIEIIILLTVGIVYLLSVVVKDAHIVHNLPGSQMALFTQDYLTITVSIQVGEGGKTLGLRWDDTHLVKEIGAIIFGGVKVTGRSFLLTKSFSSS
jgi:hypothetical protein